VQEDAAATLDALLHASREKDVVSIMGRKINRKHIALASTLPALTMAPLACLAVLFFAQLRESGFGDIGGVFLIVALYMTPVVYMATAVVFPVLVIWPPLRRPSYPTASVLGALSAWCASIALNRGWNVGHEFFRDSWLVFGAAGAASGLLYAYRVRRRRDAKA
jgi:hypothetical protein